MRSTCIKCGVSNFELVENSPRNSRYKMSFIQCAKCGGVIGVAPYEHTNTLLHNLKKDIDRLATQNDINVINENLRNLSIEISNYVKR